MIASFRDKGLSELFEDGKTAKIEKAMHTRIIRRLDALDRARNPIDMRVPGFDFHPLHGFDPPRYSVHVNGPWCITFEFDGENAAKVDLENYHH
jgi:proteic killer suppression protein